MPSSFAPRGESPRSKPSGPHTHIEMESPPAGGEPAQASQGSRLFQEFEVAYTPTWQKLPITVPFDVGWTDSVRMVG